MRTTNLRGITSALRLAALGLATLCAANCPAADGDVLAFWKFGDDGLASSTGCGTLKAGDGVTLTKGYAHFDGTTRAWLQTAGDINLKVLSAVTFDFWVRPEKYGTIFYEFGTAITDANSMSCSYTMSPLRSYFNGGPNLSAQMNGPSDIHSDGGWHHITVVYRKAENPDCMALFVDGRNVGVHVSNVALTEFPNSFLNIGCRNKVNYNLAGDIDAFRITEGAVSAEDIAKRYEKAEGRAGVMIFGADQYVTDGLVALFDANENVSLGGEHDPTAACWRNIAPNPPVGAPESLALGTGTHWNLRSVLHSDGTDAAATLDGAFVDFATVEIACDLTGFSNHRSIFECGDGSKRLFADIGKSTQCIRIDGRMTGGLIYRTTGLALQTSCTYSLGALGNDASLAINAEPCDLETNEGGAYSGTRFSLGGRHSEDLPIYPAKGDFSCLRLYNRKLTANEIRRNDFIDRVRYRGDISPSLWRTNESGAVECRVDVSVVGDGMVRIGDGEPGKQVSGWCVLGSSITVTAVPGEGGVFLRWASETVSGAGLTGTVEVPCPIAVGAVFTQGGASFTHVWAGPEGGDFSTAANWLDVVSGTTSAEPPGPTAIVNIPSMSLSGGKSWVRLTQAAEVAALQLGDDSGGAELEFDTDETLTVRGDAVLEAGTVTCTNLMKISLRVGGNLTVNAAATLTAVGCGYAGDGPGSNLSGCTHGGEKGSLTSATSAKSAYGDALFPTSFGSGSADCRGGGAIRIEVAGALTLDGLVTADGLDGVNYTGAGGSVWVTAGEIAGSGSVRADGGLFAGSYSGSGGRIAIWLTQSGADFSDFTGVLSVLGGTLNSSPYSGHGTICRGFADGRSELVLQNTDGTLCANAVRGYTTLPGDAGRATQRAMRKTAVRLGKYGVLKLTGDLIVSDMDLTEDTSALCLQGHKLTIRNRDNHQSTWKGKVDLGGGTIEWVSPPGLLFMLK